MMLPQRVAGRMRKRAVVKMRKIIMKRAKNMVTMRWMRRSCWNWRSMMSW